MRMMHTHEIVNPSDPATLMAPDDVVATLACAVLSPMYAARRDEDHIGPMLAFSGEDGPDRWAQENGAESFAALFNARRLDVRKALESVCYGDRKLFEETLADLPDEVSRDRFRDRWNDTHRSSINDIVGDAASRATAMIESEQHPELTEGAAP